MDAISTYFRDLRDIRASGSAVKETSYYPALATLLNALGAVLRPRVHCILTLKNRGAGLPDGGLFTADQLGRDAPSDSFPAPLPSRGVLEVKGADADLAQVANSEHVQRYLAGYGQVLVTNYRDFLLLGRDAQGQPLPQERYQLAADEAVFWQLLVDPAAATRLHGERLNEYLKRVLLAAAPLTNPVDVAWFLASYARDARARIDGVQLPALDYLREALEAALGISFATERGDHFFRSTLIQTLFYGVFAAWVLWHHENPEREDRFDWRFAQYYLHVPVLQELFHRIAAPAHLRPLNLEEVLNWTGAALNRVERGAFFARFDTGQAVQYFYEPFLHAFDPELRKELGVWYTPPEVVRYMVARVDQTLREELGVADGLADPQVFVLDPCTGTGAYLTEVLRQIAATLRAKGEDALLGEEVKQAALQRVFGFELLPAPFVIAHLQIGLLLQQLGVPLDQSERAAVYLTNALTGWAASAGVKHAVQHQLIGMPELAQERDAAEHVKRDFPILVVLGNPPYSGFAGIARMDEERDLSTAYRSTKLAPAPQGQGLNDIYVRFFRMAERQIVEVTKRGIVCYIANYSWLDGLSFTGMRERYLEVFDHIWIDNLHGDRVIGEYAPDGRSSETVFALDKFSAGIKIGTAIALLVKTGRPKAADGTELCYRDHEESRAAERRAALLASLESPNFAEAYQKLVPLAEIGLPFKPRQVDATYLTWPLLSELFPISSPGVKTSRDDALIAIDRDKLHDRMRAYFDPAISHASMAQIAPSLMKHTQRFSAIAIREELQQRGFVAQNIVRYCYRPFDRRWLYWEPETGLLDRERSDYPPHVFAGNLWLEARQKQAMEAFDRGYCTSLLADNFGNGLSNFFPLYLNSSAHAHRLLALSEEADVRDVGDGRRLNLSEAAVAYLERLGLMSSASALFYHSLAILHAPSYRAAHGGALRQDWPRIPLPATSELLLASAELGRQVAALLDSEHAVAGVTSGTMRDELRSIAILSMVGGGQIKLAAGDLDLTAGWGYAGRSGVTMPAKGRVVERAVSSDESCPALGLEAGDATLDIYLNERVYWRNIPPAVWGYTMSGYQVIKKWLSYRERALLERGLTVDEGREVQAIARRIAALLLLAPQLDANYRAVG
ncbi:MAG: DNA methyltransferase [Candidatus Viridilinea halotolerans]|uniref:site-specific DNA-methyltransferase (adenine-specific) n=1 Tax=Candidatus Viridilinea halotolerans TaxID=2491704 RepID=A0A426U6D8_9CHLR|nr:MAG: DNA methyltransferase [Candidatus Viridilinea halotolerans]